MNNTKNNNKITNPKQHTTIIIRVVSLLFDFEGVSGEVLISTTPKSVKWLVLHNTCEELELKK